MPQPKRKAAAATASSPKAGDAMEQDPPQPEQQQQHQQQQQQQQQQQKKRGGGGAKKQAIEEAEREEVFEKDEVVLAKDGGQIYDAKVLKVSEPKAAGGARQYFIHYQGWKSKWDKWVDAHELLKVNETNRKLQEQLKAAATKKKRGGSGASSAASTASASEAGGDDASSASEGKAGRKKGGDEAPSPPPDPDIMEDNSNEPQVKLAMPFTLKKQLVDDWEMVTREPHQLVPLPRTPSAAAILDAFIEHKRKKGSTSALQLRRFQELMEGIRMYFDKALPLILLYRHEREQYDRLAKAHNNAQQQQQNEEGGGSKAEFRASEVYGAEHLLRLFVRLPHLLAQTAMSPQEVTQVQAKLGDFLKFLQKGHAEYFLQAYKRRDEVMMAQEAPQAATAAAAAASSAAAAGKQEEKQPPAAAAEAGGEATPMEVAN